MNDRCGRLDLRPSRLDIDALLSALPARTRRAIIDALEAGGLLYGTEPQPGMASDAYGRFPHRQLDRIFSDFDEPTLKQVTSALSQVANAPLAFAYHSSK
jgi:DNA-binding transcriptional ArsR family regulator